MTERERLIRITEDSKVMERCGCHYNDVEKYINELTDYLLKNGVIVPPCKVGDTVWYITGIHHTLIKSAIVEEIIVNREGVSDLLVTSGNITFENSIDIFYFTREEAKKSLEKRRRRNDFGM